MGGHARKGFAVHGEHVDLDIGLRRARADDARQPLDVPELNAKVDVGALDRDRVRLLLGEIGLAVGQNEQPCVLELGLASWMRLAISYSALAGSSFVVKVPSAPPEKPDGLLRGLAHLLGRNAA